MKGFSIFALIIFCSTSFAAVEFRGNGWHFGDSERLDVKSVGLVANPEEVEKVAINFIDGRQIILTGSHLALGLQMINVQDKCITVIPGYQFKSVNLILNCAE